MTFREICTALNGDPELMIDRYCTPDGAYTDHDGRYWCLNPARPDRSVGSFCVHLRGARQGRWHDFSTGEGGDMLDLIRACERVDQMTALQIAKQVLGLVEVTAARRHAMAREARRRADARAVAVRRAEQDRSRRSERAQALWLSGAPLERGDPVHRYLAGRCIDLGALPRLPRVLRYHPACFRRAVDRETGETMDSRGPAMLAAICGPDGQHIGTHRTYLDVRPDGSVAKVRRDAKKVLGAKSGGAIRLWTGLGPRGGKGVPLAQAGAGTRVYITEGIEDGLCAVLLQPALRVLVAISLENLGQIALPGNVSEVVICADHDAGEQAQQQLDKAVSAHQQAGRTVRIWRAVHGKDLNDDLVHSLQQSRADHHAA